MAQPGPPQSSSTPAATATSRRLPAARPPATSGWPGRTIAPGRSTPGTPHPPTAEPAGPARSSFPIAPPAHRTRALPGTPSPTATTSGSPSARPGSPTPSGARPMARPSTAAATPGTPKDPDPDPARPGTPAPVRDQSAPRGPLTPRPGARGRSSGPGPPAITPTAHQ